MSGISPLELLLPRGRAERLLVLGTQSAAGLVPSRASRSDEDVDLVLLLPSNSELRAEGWLHKASMRAASAIGPSGVVYAVVPRRFRRRMRGFLERADLVVEPAVAHLPDAQAPRYLVPLERSPWRYALGRLISARRWSRAVLRLLSTVPDGSALLTLALPSLGLVARRAGGPHLADWIFDLTGEEREPGGAIVGTSWRGTGGPLTLHAFAAGDAVPWAVVKVASGAQQEAAALSSLGPSARAAGARVPHTLAQTSYNDTSLLVETVVAGRPAADILARSPGRFVPIVESVTDWLEQWNRATASAVVLDQAVLDSRVLVPGKSLASLLPNRVNYLRWLRARCAEVVGHHVPLVAAHNDLTMWNVAVDEDASTIAVLDWETAAQSLPLVDFFYAVTDAAAASERYASRLRAFESCFAPGGSRVSFVAQHQRRLAAAVGADPRLAELAFHSCWLRHATNERAERRDGGEFLKIVQWLARGVNRESP
jgi:hypothetical protein